jgi:hypothetical protein
MRETVLSYPRVSHFTKKPYRKYQITGENAGLATLMGRLDLFFMYNTSDIQSKS